MPGIELNAITALIPILNVSLASKDIFAGVINPFYMIEVYLSLFGFAVISVLVCAEHLMMKILYSELIIFN